MTTLIRLSLILSLFLSASVGASVGVMDATYTQISLPHPAVRVLSLSPNLSEILYEVGAGSQILARDKYSDYPPAITKVPILCDYFRMNLEHILVMKPDLIVIEESSFLKKDILRLRRIGIAVYVNKACSLNSIEKTMMDLGVLTGHEILARKKALKFREKRRALYLQYAHRSKISVFYELWDKPLLTVNRNTVINEVIESCGGKNIFDDLISSSPQVSIESVLSQNPQVILSSYLPFKKIWLTCSELNAVKQESLIYVPPAIIERTGPRILEGIEEICVALDNIRTK